ncbi:MAG: amidoligase family protein [Clostridia bacterium]|nr:amidoligase family protein [Clostridia bacterium]
MRLSENLYDNIGMKPQYGYFGIELEVENLDSNKISDKLKEIKCSSWKVDKDESLKDNGSEVVSPILSENRTRNVWKTIETICNSIKECPSDESRNPYVTKTCGGHVHFDGRVLSNNPEIFNNLGRIWAEAEELIYKMCNDKNDPIRDDAVATNIKDFIKMPATYFALLKDGMAHPSGSKLIEKINKDELKVKRFPSPRTFIDRISNSFLRKMKYNPERYDGLNTTGVGDFLRNTVEFRISNGTIDPKVIKENVFFYASLIETAIKMTKEPELMQEKVETFFNRDVSEKEKVDNFLNLIMEDDYSKNIFKERWESVKDAPVFSNYKGNIKFMNTFKKKEYKEVSEQTKRQDVNRVFSEIQNDLKEKKNSFERE